MKALVWVRRDLRLLDNPALSAAVASGLPTEAVFIYPQNPDSPLAEGAAARCYLHDSLQDLQQRLAALGIPLTFTSGDAEKLLPLFCDEHEISQLYWNRLVDPEIEAIDRRIQVAIENNGIECQRFDDDCLLMPDAAMKADGSAYRVFTAFWRNLQGVIGIDSFSDRLIPAPGAHRPPIQADISALDSLGLLPSHPWCEKLRDNGQQGEEQALNRLEDFIDHQIADYESQRDIPAVDGTSRLSPAFHFGELSVARAFVETRQCLEHEVVDSVRVSMRRFLSEIGWREFARHVLHAFPHTATRSMNPRFDEQAAWEPDPDDEHLRRWKRGETGFVLVDAGMRQLWETGWMHNRVRMVVASFLTKNLGIHWRHGASWFAQTLVDADRASNTLGWQWVAGCGTDAAPYYRIFNPDTQTKKFDPQCLYSDRWSKRANLVTPMIDLKLSRLRALERYRLAVKQTAT